MFLEPSAAAIASKRETPYQLSSLKESINQLRENLEDKEAIVDGAVRFFKLLAEGTGNKVLILNQEPLNHLLRPSLAFMIKRVKQAGPRILEAQEIILKFLNAHDEEQARTWMIKHINDFKRGYVLAGIDMKHIVLN